MKSRTSWILVASTGCGLTAAGSAGLRPSDGGTTPDGTTLLDGGRLADGAVPSDSSPPPPDAGMPPDAIDAMDDLMDESDGAPVDAVTPSPGNYVHCGSLECVPPEAGCCLPSLTCTDPASCTTGPFMACDDPTECSGGSICCASVHTPNSTIRFIACVSVSECMNPPGGNNMGFELCNPDSGEPCALGTACGANATGVTMLDSYGTCN